MTCTLTQAAPNLHLLDVRGRCEPCRGIDFKGVRTVLNVEPPSSVAGYVHRVGRTGRAGQAGCAVSLLDPRADAPLLAELRAQLPGLPLLRAGYGQD